VIRRFAAIGDIHAEDEHLAAALKKISQLDVDAILAVGDIADGPGDVERCVALLQQHNVTTVRGNHDRWVVENKMRSLPDAHLREDLSPSTVAWLSALPLVWTGESVLGPLMLCHAVGDDDMVRLQADDDASVLAENEALSRVRASGIEVMVCGHTHRPMVRSVFGLLVVNAGTLYRRDHPSFVHVDLERGEAQLFPIDGSRVLSPEPTRFSRDDVWGAF
jgi:putative phosphoesterase